MYSRSGQVDSMAMQKIAMLTSNNNSLNQLNRCLCYETYSIFIHLKFLSKAQNIQHGLVHAMVYIMLTTLWPEKKITIQISVTTTETMKLKCNSNFRGQKLDSSHQSSSYGPISPNMWHSKAETTFDAGDKGKKNNMNSDIKCCWHVTMIEIVYMFFNWIRIGRNRNGL